MIIMKIEGNTAWRCFRASGGNWIAICDPLALTVQSETWATLMEDIGETLNAMLRDLVTAGELTRFLHDRGWRLEGPVPSRPADVWFDVPFIAREADRDREVALH